MKPLLPVAALLLSSTAAFAELVPQDILDNWRGFYAGFGAIISTDTPEIEGDTTRFANLTASMSVAGTEATYVFGWIDMQRTPDGALNITFSPEAYASALADVSDETIESRTSYDFSSLTIHAEGTPEDIHYTYSAPIITGHQSQSMPEMEISTTFALQNLQGTTRAIASDGQISDSGTHTLESMSIKVNFESQDKPVYVDYLAEDLTLGYDISMPIAPIPETTHATILYPEGMLFGVTFISGPAATLVSQKTTRGTGEFTLTHSDSELSAAYAEGVLSYGITANSAALSLANSPAEATDFTAAFTRFHLGTTLPMRKSETPSPFALSLALEGFTFGAETWAKIDPDSTLSQAPASFAFSLNGTAKLFADLFDRSALTALRGAPFELRSLSLDTLSLDVEGMGLTGAGGVTFSNEHIDPMSGLPEPSGVLDFSISGALGMLDKIGRLGLIEPMVIIGAKGALGMFATPNLGPDSFTSRIEFTDGGHISVNGQQVK